MKRTWCLACILLLLTGCNLPAATATVTPTRVTATPEITITPTYPCPAPTQEYPPQVDPLSSPTDADTQNVIIHGYFDTATIQTESGTFSSVPNPNGYGLMVTVKLLPNTTHHLTVTAHVPLSTSDYCTYGGYTMTVVTDKDGNPLTIVRGVPPTPAPSSEVITPENIEKISRLASVDVATMMDGIHFAGDYELLTFGFNQAIRRWSLPALKEIGTIGPDEAQLPGVVSADYFIPKDHPTRLVVGGAGNPGGKEEFSIRVWNLEDSSLTLIGNHTGSVSAVAFSPSGNLIASGANDDMVMIWHADGSGLQAKFVSHNPDVLESYYCLHWVDEKTLWAGGNDKLYKLNASDGTLLQTIPLGGNYACDFSPDGKWFAATDQAIELKLVNLETATVTPLMAYAPDQYPGYLVDAALSPDGRLVAAINSAGMWFVWNTADGKLLLLQPASLGDGYHIAFSKEGHYLAMNGWQSPVVELWGIP